MNVTTERLVAKVAASWGILKAYFAKNQTQAIHYGTDSRQGEGGKTTVMLEYNGFLGFLILIADIYAILQIAQSSTSNGRKALWIAIVVVLPILGLIIWYLLGPKPKR